ncbi:uncharacterized protein LOC132088256 isoform X1 [Daphnia carinata]|uniref:uncharacterized protein LOC132088256 isoform X1 n=1 Tax=Daphnia carinata TaxID=120202 RepID=UPI0028684550|nr:uncharacterized protein LOC132088256 isoform X1 [Daphnia carinata]XP_059352733.1 uncharacterized protein LOC132088256 isoform X1 [Daphnia carinata]
MHRVPIHQKKCLFGFKWLLITLIVTSMIGPSAESSVKKMLDADSNRPLMYSMLLKYPMLSTEAGLSQTNRHPIPVLGLPAKFRARPTMCRGKRLDSMGSFSPENYITADQCMMMGGDCCNLSPAWGHAASNDPSYMKPLDRCHGCYDTSFTVQCTGNVLRTREKYDEEDDNVISPNQVTASTCIGLGGQCCDPRSALELFGGGLGVFDPRRYPREEHCANCFSGSAYRLECTGNLLQSESYTADVCRQFGGQCCQDIYGAFDPAHYPNRDCSICFSDSMQPQ